MYDTCTCGSKFRMAEDFRDHMPCPGTRLEQLEFRIKFLETNLRELTGRPSSTKDADEIKLELKGILEHK